jgi:hypothetical protein
MIVGQIRERDGVDVADIVVYFVPILRIIRFSAFNLL